MIKVLLITNPKSGILSFEDSLNIVINEFKKYSHVPEKQKKKKSGKDSLQSAPMTMICLCVCV